MEIAIIGCGGISHAHARAARSLGGRVRFASCCDTDAERARAWAARYGAERTYASLAALLSRASAPVTASAFSHRSWLANRRNE